MIIRAIGIALIALGAGLMLKGSIPSFTALTVFSAGIIILILCFDSIREVLEYFYDVCNKNEYGNYFKVMLKGLGIAYLAGVGADLCRDCGETQLAGRVELAAKTEILIIAFPLIKGIIELSESILIL